MISIILAAVVAATNCEGRFPQNNRTLTRAMSTATNTETNAWVDYYERPPATIYVTLGDTYPDASIKCDGSTVKIDANAISTVIVTNAPVVTDNSETWGLSSQIWIRQGGSIFRSNPDKPATERTETSTVTEVSTLTLTWDGKPYTIKRERVIDTIVKRFRLTPSKWEDVTP